MAESSTQHPSRRADVPRSGPASSPPSWWLACWPSASSCIDSRGCRSTSSAGSSGRPTPGIRSPAQFGARPFIWGTLYSSVLAILISTPIALGIAIYISELAPAMAADAAGVPDRAAGRDSVDRLRPVGRLRAGALRAPAPGGDAGRVAEACRSSAVRRSASACSPRR